MSCSFWGSRITSYNVCYTKLLRLVAEQLSWVSGESAKNWPHTHWVYTAKPRYRTPDQPCEIDAISPAGARIAFAQPQCVITSYSIHYTKLYDAPATPLPQSMTIFMGRASLMSPTTRSR